MQYNLTDLKIFYQIWWLNFDGDGVIRRLTSQNFDIEKHFQVKNLP